jgi:hypothetical protein
MQILIAVIVMGVIATVATALVAAAALLQLAPLVVAALVVLGVVHRWQRRRPLRPAPSPLSVSPPTAVRPAARARPVPPRPDGWVLVPMWWLPEHRTPRPVVDAEVISVEENHG